MSLATLEGRVFVDVDDAIATVRRVAAAQGFRLRRQGAGGRGRGSFRLFCARQGVPRARRPGAPAPKRTRASIRCNCRAIVYIMPTGMDSFTCPQTSVVHNHPPEGSEGTGNEDEVRTASAKTRSLPRETRSQHRAGVLAGSEEEPHMRLNLLTNEWVLVCPQRLKRPWQGRIDPATRPSASATSESRQRAPLEGGSNYLAPGALRANGQRNPMYIGPYTFENDFPALLPDGRDTQGSRHVLDGVGDGGQSPVDAALFRRSHVAGTCRVTCFGPDPEATLATMNQNAIEAVITEWQNQQRELGASYAWVQVFENRGSMMGCSAPHPHSQVWALSELPNEAQREDSAQRLFLRNHRRPLLLQYAEREVALQRRVVCANADWVVVVPYWATWPFETLVLPARRHILRLDDVTEDERSALANVLHQLLCGYDALFSCSFPYSMGWHGAPTGPLAADATRNGAWQLHAHYYPPLLRSATVRKFMVGFEMLAMPQRDLCPEKAAEMLRGAIARGSTD